MRAIRDKLAHDLSDLRVLVSSIKPVRDALRTNSSLSRYIALRPRFDYSAFVISLYSSFENFVESLVRAYVVEIASLGTYESLPEKLRQHHLSKSAHLLNRRLDEGRYSGITYASVVENLHSCLSGISEFRLNDIAIASHDSNLREQQIVSMFSLLNLSDEVSRINRVSNLQAWYKASTSATKVKEHRLKSSITRALEELVERRNEVAHRGGPPTNLLGPEDMQGQIDFVDAYSEALYTVAVTGFLAKVAGQVPELATSEHRGSSIVIVDYPSIPVTKGQAAFTLENKKYARWGRVKDIHVNDRSVVCSSEVKGNTLGLKLDFKVGARGTLFLIPEGSTLEDKVWARP